LAFMLHVLTCLISRPRHIPCRLATVDVSVNLRAGVLASPSPQGSGRTRFVQMRQRFSINFVLCKLQPLNRLWRRNAWWH
jgi:hypothetical protein